MKFEKFCERVREDIADEMSAETNIMIQPVLKNNGRNLTGLIISEPETNISPTIYLEPYYEEYMKGQLFSDVVFEILEVYEENKQSKDFDISVVKDWEKAKSNIICKLVNYDLNKDMLQDVPHKQVEDLAVVYMIFVNDFQDEFATILIRDNFLEYYGKTVEDLDAVARENVKRICPPRLSDMRTILEEHTGTTLPDEMETSMYVLTNKQKINGAIHILNTDVMDEIGNVFGEKCMVIPSSVHEVIILPYDINEFNHRDLEEMIEEVNETQLTTDEVLSYKAYILDTKNHVLRLAEHDPEYLKELEQKMMNEEQMVELLQNLGERFGDFSPAPEIEKDEERREKDAEVIKKYEQRIQKEETSPKL